MELNDKIVAWIQRIKRDIIVAFVTSIIWIVIIVAFHFTPILQVNWRLIF